MELGCGGAEKRCRMHGSDCSGPNEKVAVTLAGISMENGVPGLRNDDFLLRNDDFLLRNDEFVKHNASGGLLRSIAPPDW